MHQYLKHAVRLELVLHLYVVESQEHQELSRVNQVPDVIEVVPLLLLHLHALEDHEEDLGEQHNDVEDVKEEGVVRAQRYYVWQQEPNHVEHHDELNELTGLVELEVNDLAHCLLVVEVNVLLVFDPEDASKMVVVEVDVPVVMLLDVPYLLSDDHLCEDNGGVLYLDVSFLHLLWALILLLVVGHFVSFFAIEVVPDALDLFLVLKLVLHDLFG